MTSYHQASALTPASGPVRPFNTSKCKVMHIGRINQKFQYSMDNQNLKTVSDQRDLGVQLTADLKPSIQCQKAYTKASKVLDMITWTFSYKGRDTMVPLYKSLVRPHLAFCVSAWSPYYKKDRVVRTGSTLLHQNVSRSTNITICWQITVPWLVVLGRETKSFRSVGSLQNVQRGDQNRLWQHVYAQQCYDYKRTHS